LEERTLCSLKENETISDSKFDFKTDTYIENLNSPISCKEVRKALKSLKNTFLSSFQFLFHGSYYNHKGNHFYVM
jgi:hypothetical protein